MDTSSFKKCKSCALTKAVEDFPFFSTSNAGRKNTCKSCNKKLSQIRKELRASAGAPPSKCECCGREPSKALVLDHNHDTDEFRGWLCQSCNIGIGRLGDNLEGVFKAVEYLRRVG